MLRKRARVYVQVHIMVEDPRNLTRTHTHDVIEAVDVAVAVTDAVLVEVAVAEPV